ncbi:ectonucleotide pyrophosphatase/phosphodiesterase family member 1 isoform X1 [Haplochromis burtoni]|uniref:Ectonucleotide pyrophosphatase/phosphodiesterase 1 n=2 Tax=Haplochromis burtoni TaxID=8153 RepID=A0A3Q2X0E0_HAPBU|nr:ectonucleotide pyrophosphatase/phosphodiesterase family member 1 isoform X1 [Haplochromis burtoni]
MEVTKGEDGSAEQAASLFGTREVESQRSMNENKRSTRRKIIIGVLLLCLLVVILAVVIFLRKEKGSGGEVWMEGPFQEVSQPQCPSGFSKPPLILVSLDGFRAAYLKEHASHMPVISKLRNNGTTTPYLRPVYPTKTFPNHYTIVTGLYPESHGIVDNKMYDVKQNAFFSLKTDEKLNPQWYQGEPVWLTAIYQKLKSATFFWPGSDVAINGTLPSFYKMYDKSVAFEKRVSTLLDWLNLPEGERPDFYTLYLDEPDSTGHYYGPESTQIVPALQRVDRILGMLMDGLKAKNLHNCVNIIVASDHGMESASCERASYVSDFQKDTSGFTVIQGPAARIRPSRLPQDYSSFDYEGLVKNLSCRTVDQPMRPYLKENLPKRMHFAKNIRIERGHLYMKSGWQAALKRSDIKYCTGGFHGSDNLFTNMQAIFIGYGPAFKHSTVVPTFENIELYNLMCDLLGIRPSPNNGTHGSLNHLLKHPVHNPVLPAQLSHDILCNSNVLFPSDNLQCTCESQTTEMVEQMNGNLLALSSSEKSSLRRLHEPFGIPRVIQSGATFCLLHHLNYLSGYSKDRLMPLWVSYTIQPLTRVQPLSPELEACVRADVRIPANNSQQCLRYKDNSDLAYGLLHPPNLSANVSDSLITSNMAPMFPAFKAVWTHFHDVFLPKYSQQLNGVNVMSGPIFDKDYDGHVDELKKISGNEAPIPTHFFVILTSCGDSTFGPLNCAGPLQARSFIMPHRPDHTESCANGTDLTWVEDWLKLHTARVRDIELLTGLSFYHDRLSVEETLRMKTFLHTY